MPSFTAVPKVDYPNFSYKERRFVTRLKNRCDYLSNSKSKSSINEFEAMKWLLRTLAALGKDPAAKIVEDNEAYRRLISRRNYLAEKENATSFEREEFPALVWALDLAYSKWWGIVAVTK